MAAPNFAELSAAESVPALAVFPELRIIEWDTTTIGTKTKPAEGIGHYTTTLVTMNDGSRYAKRDIFPARERQDVRIEMMTAWCTRVSGMNTEFGMEVGAKSDSEVSIIGPNQAHRHRTSLAQDAWAANLIMVAADARLGVGPGDRKIIAHGKSRGGMGANGKAAYKDNFGRDIALVIPEDPCLLHATGKKETRESLTIRDILEEGGELVHDLAQRREDESHFKHMKRVARFARTIGVTPEYLLVQLHSGQALWKGDHGTFLKNLNREQAMVTLFLNKNDLNHRDEYAVSTADLPNSHIIDRNFKHLALIRNNVIAAGTDSIRRAVKLLDKGTDPAEVAAETAIQYELAIAS